MLRPAKRRTLADKLKEENNRLKEENEQLRDAARQLMAGLTEYVKQENWNGQTWKDDKPQAIARKFLGLDQEDS